MPSLRPFIDGVTDGGKCRSLYRYHPRCRDRLRSNAPDAMAAGLILLKQRWQISGTVEHSQDFDFSGKLAVEQEIHRVVPGWKKADPFEARRSQSRTDSEVRLKTDAGGSFQDVLAHMCRSHREDRQSTLGPDPESGFAIPKPRDCSLPPQKPSGPASKNSSSATPAT